MFSIKFIEGEGRLTFSEFSFIARELNLFTDTNVHFFFLVLWSTEYDKEKSRFEFLFLKNKIIFVGI